MLGIENKIQYMINLFFGNFRKKSNDATFNLKLALEKKVISKEEYLLIKKNRAITEYDNETKPKVKRK